MTKKCKTKYLGIALVCHFLPLVCNNNTFFTAKITDCFFLLHKSLIKECATPFFRVKKQIKLMACHLWYLSPALKAEENVRTQQFNHKCHVLPTRGLSTSPACHFGMMKETLEKKWRIFFNTDSTVILYYRRRIKIHCLCCLMNQRSTASQIEKYHLGTYL